MNLYFLFIIILFMFGAAIGSFTSVLIYRLHSDKNGIFRGRSHCPECETQLQPFDLLPIVSFLTLRGKCRYCNKEISYMYPLLELITGALFVLLFLKFPFVDSALHFSGTLLSLYLLYAFYVFVLVFSFFFDLRYLKVADEILLPGILVGLLATIATPLTPHIIDALLGAGVAIVFFGLQIFLSKGTWVGLGDLRIGAFMGVILGWKLMLVALFVSYMMGSVISLFIIIREKKMFGIKIPFAPMLVTGTLVTIFLGEEIIGWYLQTFAL